MQTFMPWSSYVLSARSLDPKRLNKQRVETFQILRALTDPEYGWQHHPAVNQWRGYVKNLAVYGAAIDAECFQRGIADNRELGKRIGEYETWFSGERSNYKYDRPPWVSDPRFHLSHQGNLVRKDPVYYTPEFPDADPDLPYFWPSKEADYA